MTFPTVFADFLKPFSYVFPSTCIAYKIRRCTGFKPSRASGSARSCIIYLLYRPNRSPMTSSSGRSRNTSFELIMVPPPLLLIGFRYQECYLSLPANQIPHLLQSIFVVVLLYHPSML